MKFYVRMNPVCQLQAVAAEKLNLRLSDLFCIYVQKLLGSHEPSSVQLWVSYNRQPMKAAQFMTRHPITVSVFSCVQKCFTQHICP